MGFVLRLKKKKKKMSKFAMLMPARVLIAYDATKDMSELEFMRTIYHIRSRGDVLHSGDTIMVLGVLHKVQHPMGYQMQSCQESFFGTIHDSVVQEAVSKKVELYLKMLKRCAEECESEGFDIEVKIVAGSPIKKVVLQEAVSSKTTWVILDRHLRRDLRYYLKQVPCKVAVVEDNMSMTVSRSFTISETENIEHKMVFCLSKHVTVTSALKDDKNEQYGIPCQSNSAFMGSSDTYDTLRNNLVSSSSHNTQDHYATSDHELVAYSQDKSVFEQSFEKGDLKLPSSSKLIENLYKRPSRLRYSDAPVLCTGCGMKTEPDIKESMRFSFSEIQLATDDFSKDKLIGEGGYGHVYEGRLSDGQRIAAKVRKEASTQGFAEFHSEIFVLSFARHKNIVMLLGYCCKENLNILVYEYICNKSLEWHLFENTENALEWHRRHAIAVGTAKGLRFLHEECRGSPIIHRDMRPSNILLTHDFVPMLGDFGLAKWRLDEDAIQTKILGTLGYLAPEYAENGIISVRTDVYSFGIVLIQLISGRKAVDSDREDQQQSLRQWAIPLIQRLALHELIDPRIRDSYDTYELYHMARAAYLCVQTDPEMRPSMGEVLRLLEGESDHFNLLVEQFVPHFSK